MGVFELPNDAPPQVRIEAASASEDIARVLRDSRPVVQSRYDVYLDWDRLVYVKNPCVPDDFEARFFLHVYPVDANDLPEHRKQYGYDNLDFPFQGHGWRADEKCLAVRELPNYAIQSIKTGQHVPGEGRVWEGGFEVAEDWTLWRFEDGFDGWLLEGDAVTNHSQHPHYAHQQEIIGDVYSKTFPDRVAPVEPTPAHVEPI